MVKYEGEEEKKTVELKKRFNGALLRRASFCKGYPQCYAGGLCRVQVDVLCSSLVDLLQNGPSHFPFTLRVSSEAKMCRGNG